MCVEPDVIERLLRRAPQFDTLRDAYVWVRLHHMYVSQLFGVTELIEIAEVLYREQNADGV